MIDQHAFKPPPFDVTDDLCRKVVKDGDRFRECFETQSDASHCEPAISEGVKEQIRELLRYASGDDPDAAEVIRRANAIARRVETK